jgi:hypothetical protein
VDSWAKQRLAKLQAAAPTKRKRAEPFAVVPLQTAAKAFSAMRCPKAMVWLWLIHQTRKTGRRTISVPSGILAKLGVKRETKRRALKELAADGLILLDQRTGKPPLATLL